MAVKKWGRALLGNVAWLLRPRLPWSIARRLLPLRINKVLASPELRAIAVEEMTLLLGKVSTPEEIADVARRYLEFATFEAEFRWHPRRSTEQRVEGLDHLHAAQALGRGVVVSFVHHGLYAGMFGAIKRAGVDHVTVVREGALGWYERPNQRQNFLLFKRGGDLVDVRVGTDGVVDRLSRGDVVMIATDVEGSSRATLAGREVRCSSGAIWAAKRAKAPILAIDAYRTEDGHVIRFSEPWLPEDFGDPTELLQRVVTHHEGAILQWPEATLAPSLTWVSADA